jgi:hypothetical protein
MDAIGINTHRHGVLTQPVGHGEYRVGHVGGVLSACIASAPNPAIAIE